MSRWSLGLAAALSALAVGGCGSSTPHAAAVPVAPPVTAIPKPVTTPTPVPVPAATPFVSAGDEAGAYVFVKAYFAELDRAYAPGDVAGLAPYRLPSCSCLGFERDIDSYYGHGGRIIGTQVAIDDWVSGAHGPAFAQAAIRFHTRPATNLLSGRARTTTPEESGYYVIDLRRVADRWLLRDVRYSVGG